MAGLGAGAMSTSKSFGPPRPTQPELLGIREASDVPIRVPNSANLTLPRCTQTNRNAPKQAQKACESGTSKPAGRGSPALGRFDSFAAPWIGFSNERSVAIDVSQARRSCASTARAPTSNRPHPQALADTGDAG